MSRTATIIESTICPPLGDSIPSLLPHAISVSLPTWKDMVGYEKGEKRVIDAMCTGYPRFFIHKSLQKLAAICERKFALQAERCLLFPKESIANHCRDFLMASSLKTDGVSITVRLVEFLIHAEKGLPTVASSSPSTLAGGDEITLHIVLFPSDAYPVARQFWQHTGLGISSRMADRCLALLENDASTSGAGNLAQQVSNSHNGPLSPSRNKHYTIKNCVSSVHGSTGRRTSLPPASSSGTYGEDFCVDQAMYLEERYGRNMPLTDAAAAKRTLRRRIAGVLAREDVSSPTGDDELRPSIRGEGVTEDDVYLFPSGMSAIWSAHQLCLNALSLEKSICFGFPYTDTLKILQKWGPGCHFFGNGDEADLDRLDSFLSHPDAPHIVALFCEFPSNPLLRSVNLIRLRDLADRYGFVIVIDETVGNFANVKILPHADIVVSSLTKVFSGESNVMGGSLILNPRYRYYSALKKKLEQKYEDSYWGEDAIYMERNSRDFAKRVRIINRNAEALCELLRSHINVTGPPNNHTSSIVKEVYYPKWQTRSNYDICRMQSAILGLDGQAQEAEEGNFGGLFSVTFTSNLASEAFFDALPCAKGPSLGTNFTLACPYAILAHFTELEWAAQHGVEEGLVRVSVGLEDPQLLLSWFEASLKTATEAVSKLSQTHPSLPKISS